MPVFLGDKWALSVGIFLSMWCVSRGVRESGDIYVFVRSTLPDFVAGHERCRWRCLFSLLGIGKREGRIRKTVCRRRDSGFSLASGKALRQGER